MSNKDDNQFIFAEEGDRIYHRRVFSQTLETTLAANVYSVSYCPKTGYFFRKLASSFKMPPKLYGGDIERKTTRILNTFRDRPRSTGVLLNGRKGAGKTLLAKNICNMSEMPVITVTEPHCDNDFMELLKNIGQDKIVLFDEFEKVYHEMEAQNALLTLLDGVYDSRTLFLLVTNSTEFMATQLKNRPGRIFYYINYDGLQDSFVRDYSLEHLHRKEYAETLVKLNSLVSDFNFDLMASIIEECNRYQCAPRDCVGMLNMESNPKQRLYNVELRYRGEPLQLRYNSDSKYVNLEDGGFDFSICAEWWKEAQKLPAYADYPMIMYPHMVFSLEDLTAIKDGVYTFEQNGVTLTMRQSGRATNLLDFI